MADKVKLVSSTHIYMDVRALLDDVLDVTVNFPKLYKYSVGARMQNLTVDLMQDVASAYMNKDKELRIQYLVNFQTKFETLRTLMRITGDSFRSICTTRSVIYQVRDLVQTSDTRFTAYLVPRKILVPITINTTVDSLFDIRFK